jgi:predicted transcriptional regulator of viral defense system
MAYVSEDKAKAAERLIRGRGGTIRTGELREMGIHTRILYHLRDEGRLEQVSRGVYRLTELPDLSEPDLVAVAKRVPEAVICLISALAFHEITTEIPHEIHIALPRQKRTPWLEYPPIRVYRFSSQALNAGVETHRIDGVQVHVFNAAKTVADCIKFRNQIGQDVANQALRMALESRKARPSELLEYARVCRVDSLMRTYLEALS